MSKDEKEQPLRRFWKPRRNMPSVEWDGEKEKPVFEFIQGVFETRDQKLAARLLKLGYMEITGVEGPIPRKPPLDDVPDPEASRDISPLVSQMAAMGIEELQPAVPD